MFGKAIIAVAAAVLISQAAMSQAVETLPPPLPILPADMTCTTERLPVFRWNNRYDVKSYILELSSNADFKGDVIRVEGIPPSSPDVVDAKRDYAIIHTDYQLKDSDIPYGMSNRRLFGLAGSGLNDGQWYWRVGYATEKGTESPASQWRAFEVSETDKDKIDIPRNLEHPYLYFTKATLPALKGKLERPECKKFKDGLMLKAGQLLADTPPVPSCKELDLPFKNVNTQHGGYLSLGHRMRPALETLGLVYQLTGDRRYADKAKELMLKLATLERWNGSYDFYHPKWNSALENGELCKSYATCYDWIYETLTPEERKVLVAGLVKNGIDPLKDWFDPNRYCELPRHQMPYRNWVMVCCGGAGVASLAIVNEHEDAKKCVRLIRDRMRSWIAYRGGDWAIRDSSPSERKPFELIEPNFDQDGGYVESISYFVYATRMASYYMSALENVSGVDLFKLLPDNALDPFVYFMYEGGVAGKDISDPRFGDSNEIIFPEIVAIMAARRNDPVAQWLFGKLGGGEPGNISTFLEYSPAIPAVQPKVDGVKLFRGIGQVVMRSGWGPDQDMLAIKYHQNRGHLDIGGFTLFALGKELAIDSGSGPYPSRRYRDYLSVTEAHNVVMVDGKRQRKADGEILSYFKTPSSAYVCGELKNAYPEGLESWRRHVLFLRPDCYVMLDEMRGRQPHSYDWLFHNGGELSASSGKNYDWRIYNAGGLSIEPDCIKVKNGDARLLVKMAGHGKMKAETVKLDFPEEERKYSYVKIHPEGKVKDFDFLTLLLPYADDEELDGVKEISGDGCNGFEVKKDGAVETVLHSAAGKLSYGRLAGEAKMASASFDGKGSISQFTLCEGKSLSLDGKPLVLCDAPLIGGLSFQGSSARGSLSIASAGDVRLSCPFEVHSVLIDGVKADFKSLGGGMLSIALPTGSHEIALNGAETSL